MNKLNLIYILAISSCLLAVSSADNKQSENPMNSTETPAKTAEAAVMPPGAAPEKPVNDSEAIKVPESPQTPPAPAKESTTNASISVKNVTTDGTPSTQSMPTEKQTVTGKAETTDVPSAPAAQPITLSPTTVTLDNNKTAENGTKPDEGKDVKPSNATSEAPAKRTDEGKDNAVVSGGFDGPSFVGGIILTMCLLAVSFIGFKYYKARTERNYHTL